MSDIEITKKGDSLLISGIADKIIKIPSQMYPLNSSKPLEFITSENTENFDDSPESNKIKEIFDSIEAGVGTCYSNIEQLISKLELADIKAIPYCGWMFIGTERPIHHCFAVIDNHILDYAEQPSYFYSPEMQNISLNEARELIVNKLLNDKDTKNSDKGTFGKLSPGITIVANPCVPADGRKQFMKLMQAFPNHPSYQKVKNGLSKTQEMYYKAKSKQNKS